MRTTTLSKLIALIVTLGAATGCPPREKKEEHKPGDGHDHAAPDGSAEEHKPGDGHDHSKDEKK